MAGNIQPSCQWRLIYNGSVLAARLPVLHVRIDACFLVRIRDPAIHCLAAYRGLPFDAIHHPDRIKLGAGSAMRDAYHRARRTNSFDSGSVVRNHAETATFHPCGAKMGYIWMAAKRLTAKAAARLEDLRVMDANQLYAWNYHRQFERHTTMPGGENSEQAPRRTTKIFCGRE